MKSIVKIGRVFWKLLTNGAWVLLLVAAVAVLAHCAKEDSRVFFATIIVIYAIVIFAIICLNRAEKQLDKIHSILTQRLTQRCGSPSDKSSD